MDRQTVERRREYVQNIRNFFMRKTGCRRERPERWMILHRKWGLAAALKLRIFYLYVYLQLFRLHVYPYGFCVVTARRRSQK